MDAAADPSLRCDSLDFFNPNGTKSKFRELYKTVITVKVGTEPKKESFFIHKELACSKLPFFRAAMSGAWEEAKTGVVVMPDDDPEVFSLFQDWLYTSTLRYERVIAHQADKDELQFVMEIIIFADKIGAIDLHYKAIDLIVQVLRKVSMHGQHVHFAYDNTAFNADLRQLLTCITVHRLKEARESDPVKGGAWLFLGNLAEYPPRFVNTVFRHYWKKVNTSLGPVDPFDFYVASSDGNPPYSEG